MSFGGLFCYSKAILLWPITAKNWLFANIKPDLTTFQDEFVSFYGENTTVYRRRCKQNTTECRKSKQKIQRKTPPRQHPKIPLRESFYGGMRIILRRRQFLEALILLALRGVGFVNRYQLIIIDINTHAPQNPAGGAVLKYYKNSG